MATEREVSIRYNTPWAYNIHAAYLVDMEDYRTELLVSLAKAKKIALENIRQAQVKQKEFYDRHAGNPWYRVGERVIVYMPGDLSGKR